jgi:beta-N-acetylhexosaminidase
MTLDALARGVIAAGFEDGEIERLPAFGGYVLFSRNGTSPSQVRTLTAHLRARSDPPPVIAIDQEGGRVARLRDGVEPMPPMMALGAAADGDLAQRAGEQIGFDLRRAGCTMDFAPVLDLALKPRNTVIGTRSLGSDPAAVAALGRRFGRGLETAGILPCYKHFPGHGATSDDSHVELPSIDADAATLRARDLVPFAAVVPGAAACMSAHVIVRAFDAARPATLSAVVAQGLLRAELGFDGAYVTDALEMGAIADAAAGAVAALQAGADLLVVGRSSALACAAADSIVSAVESGALALERLEEAHERVRRLRLAGSAALPLDAFPPHPGVGREIARRAITLIRGMAHADPVTACAVSFEAAVASGAEELGASDRLTREAPALGQIVLALDPERDNVENALVQLAAMGRRPIVLARRAHVYAGQADAVARIVERFPDAVVVSMLEPYDLPLFGAARHLLAAYGDDAASIGGLADVLFGGSLPQGRLPVDLTRVE